jgi:hypothetical protein
VASAMLAAGSKACQQLGKLVSSSSKACKQLVKLVSSSSWSPQCLGVSTVASAPVAEGSMARIKQMILRRHAGMLISNAKRHLDARLSSVHVETHSLRSQTRVA